MGYVGDDFNLDDYKETGGEGFDLLPDGTFVIVEITAAPGKTNSKGALYAAVESKAVMIPAGLTGNFGVPKFWDHSSFINPSKPDPTLPADELEKAGKRVGMWKRRVHALGLDPKLCPNDSPEALAAFYADAIGLLVGVRVRVEPPNGAYGAKNSIRDYYPDTPELRAKHKLTVQGGGSTAASFAVGEDGEIEL